MLLLVLCLWLGSGLLTLAVVWLVTIRGERPQPVHRRPSAGRLPGPRRA
jgi:hypothetical protein